MVSLQVALPVLPLEILEEIGLVSSTSEQLLLSRASRVFHSVTRRIYRDISLADPKSAVLCCRTLATNWFLSQLVESLHISFVLEYGTSSFVSLLNQAFLNLGNLNVLRVFLGPHWSSILCNVQFHQLTRFNSHFLLDEELIRFLTRHPAIEHLQLSDVSSQPVTQISDVYLPRLRHLVANSSWFGPLSRASQLRSAFVTFNLPDINGPLNELDLSSGHSLNVLGCQRDGWNLDLLDFISTRFSGILGLSIINQPIPEQHGAEIPVEAVQDMLSRFPYLVKIYFRTHWQLSHSFASLDEEYSTVLRWASACPTLRLCALPNRVNVEWVRTLSNNWVPDLTESRDSETLDWVFSRLTCVKEDTWSQGVSMHILQNLLHNVSRNPAEVPVIMELVRDSALNFVQVAPTLPPPNIYSDMPPLI